MKSSFPLLLPLLLILAIIVLTELWVRRDRARRRKEWVSSRDRRGYRTTGIMQHIATKAVYDSSEYDSRPGAAYGSLKHRE